MATTIVVPVDVVPQAIKAHKKNIIQVSNTKKRLFFYVNLAKTYIQQHNEVELSGLGMAITTVVTITKILKNNGLATEKSQAKSTVDQTSQLEPAFAQLMFSCCKTRLYVLDLLKNYSDMFCYSIDEIYICSSTFVLLLRYWFMSFL
ncbi:hypothetical protein UlMin_012709 [Ulmus minor]